MKRLEADATTLEEVTQYYTARAMQALYDKIDVTWNKDLEPLKGWGYRTTFTIGGVLHESVYVLKDYRGRGYAQTYLETSTLPIATNVSCNIEGFLTHIGKPYTLIASHVARAPYKLIQRKYGDDRAKRSQVYFMNHIDEGLGVLKLINASMNAAMGFCLHPLVQMDADLVSCLAKEDIPDGTYDSRAIILAMEYRAVANAYLSTRMISGIEDIQLSPLKDVNDMLIADKIQNYKDFRLYHKGTHPRSKELDEYFHNWFQKLGLSTEQVEQIISAITI